MVGNLEKKNPKHPWKLKCLTLETPPSSILHDFKLDWFIFTSFFHPSKKLKKTRINFSLHLRHYPILPRPWTCLHNSSVDLPNLHDKRAPKRQTGPRLIYIPFISQFSTQMHLLFIQDPSGLRWNWTLFSFHPLVECVNWSLHTFSSFSDLKCNLICMKSSRRLETRSKSIKLSWNKLLIWFRGEGCWCRRAKLPGLVTNTCHSNANTERNILRLFIIKNKCNFN